MLALLLLFSFQFPVRETKPTLPPTTEELHSVMTYGTQAGTAKIARHWWDFHKQRDGKVTIKLHADLRAPIYRVRDVTEPGASFLVVDPDYAHADHFIIRGKKGHTFRWSVAGRP